MKGGVRAWAVVDKVGGKSTVYADHVVQHANGTRVCFYPTGASYEDTDTRCIAMFREPASVKLLSQEEDG